MTDREKIIKIAQPYVSAWGDDERLADALIENRFGNVADWKRRAEVAERALLILCDKVMRNVLVMAFPSTKAQVRNKQELYDYCMEQAEKELTEGKRDE